MNQSRHLSLEDVLQDPHASWSQIREAMKSSRGCTNAAVMGAIASGRGCVTVVVPDDECSLDEGGKPSTVGVELQVPIKDAAPEHDHRDLQQQDVTNSRNRRPSRRSPASRGSFRNSYNSGTTRSSLRMSRRRSSCGSLNASVNMMDFGVEPNGNRAGMGTLDESESLDGRLMTSRRESLATSVDSCGFLGWSHGEDDDECSMPSLGSNYSNLVDSSGFLDWERKSILSTQSDSEEQVSGTSPSLACRVMHELASERARPNPLPMSSNGSVTSSSNATFAAGQKDVDVAPDIRPIEQWNIEDYENPQDNQVAPCSSRTNSIINRGGSNGRGTNRQGFFRRLSTVSAADLNPLAAPPGASNGLHTKEEVNMDDIKEALIKVAARNHDPCRSAPTSRQCSLDEKDTADKYVPCTRSTRRRTVCVEMPAFLRGISESKDSDNSVGHGKMQAVVGMQSPGMAHGRRATLIGMHSIFPSKDVGDDSDDRSNNYTQPPLHRGGSGGMPLAMPSSQERDVTGGGSMWGGLESSRYPHHERHDSRDAIRIDRSDGDVDIEKERRRLLRTPS